MDIPTNARLPPNKYYVFPITIWDAAGNVKELIPNMDQTHYESNWGGHQDPLPITFLTVENDHPDLTPPVVKNARFEPATIRAGDSGRLVFEATDDDPAFTIAAYCEPAVLQNWTDYRRSDVPAGSSLDPTEYAVNACGTPRHRPDGAWEVDFTSQPHIPAGSYRLWISVMDAVHNANTPVEAAALTVTNDAAIDTEGPVLLDAKPAKALYHPGETGTILFKVVDNLSGVTRALAQIYGTCDMGLEPVLNDPDDMNKYVRVPLCDSQFRHVEGDWYAIDFVLGANVPTGEYWLPHFSFADLVGNSSELELDGPNDGPYTYTDLITQRASHVPVIRFQVVR